MVDVQSVPGSNSLAMSINNDRQAMWLRYPQNPRPPTTTPFQKFVGLEQKARNGALCHPPKNGRRAGSQNLPHVRQNGLWCATPEADSLI